VPVISPSRLGEEGGKLIATYVERRRKLSCRGRVDGRAQTSLEITDRALTDSSAFSEFGLRQARSKAKGPHLSAEPGCL
jgi:hypothetical protein